MRLRTGKYSKALKVEDVQPDPADQRTNHNASTALLSLPYEIKTMIYGFTFGNQTLHIHQALDEISNLANVHRHSGKFCHSICQAPLNDVEAHNLFTTTKPNDQDTKWTVEALETLHDTCNSRYIPEYTTKRNTVPNHTQRLPLQVLRTCRQVYTEASMLPIHTNIFAFHCPIILDQFLALSLPPHRLTEPRQPKIKCIRSLSLGITISHTETETEWASTLANLPALLPHLRTLNITIHEHFCVCWFPMARESVDTILNAEERALYKALRDLRGKMPELRNVRIVIEDGEFLNRNFESDTWWEEDSPARTEYGKYRSTLVMKQERAGLVEGWINGTVEEDEEGDVVVTGEKKVVKKKCEGGSGGGGEGC